MSDRGTDFILGTTETTGVYAERQDAPAAQRGPAGAAMQAQRPEAKDETEERAELLPASEAQELRSRWDKIQAGFVDEPRRSVKDADTLVDETIKRLADTFSQARAQMEQGWDRGASVSTENLRMALRRYRSFFNRLLSM